LRVERRLLLGVEQRCLVGGRRASSLGHARSVRTRIPSVRCWRYQASACYQNRAGHYVPASVLRGV
jgi:hypothetical protein